jgi:hypothetical protein
MSKTAVVVGGLHTRLMCVLPAAAVLLIHYSLALTAVKCVYVNEPAAVTAAAAAN